MTKALGLTFFLLKSYVEQCNRSKSSVKNVTRLKLGCSDNTPEKSLGLTNTFQGHEKLFVYLCVTDEHKCAYFSAANLDK